MTAKVHRVGLVLRVLSAFWLAGCASTHKTAEVTLETKAKEAESSLEQTIRHNGSERDAIAVSDSSSRSVQSEGREDEFDEEDGDWEAELTSFGPAEIDYAERDPLEKMNKVLYGLHRGVDLLFVRPIALTYSKALPKPVQSGVANFVSNLLAPARALCHVLQGHWKEAGRTLGRFATNTLLGGGGLVDVAGKMKATEVSTNFTETLKTWGVKPGPYLVVPGVGPTTFRGALGFLLDSFLDPVFLFALNKNLPGNKNRELVWKDTAVQLGSLLISRAKIDSIYEDVEKNSVNRYSKLRTLVLQQSINR